MKIKNKWLYASISILLIVVIITASIFVVNSSDSIYGKNLMSGIRAKGVKECGLDERFINSATDFSIELFKRGQTEGVNSLISPLSVYIALAMTANGADGETLRQFEEVLGDGMPIDELNNYIYSLIKSLPSEKDTLLNIVNSIWFDDKSVEPYRDFLQNNANYYGASMYASDFKDEKTVDSVNKWVKDKTGGLIDRVLEEIEQDDVMFLINTLLFDGKWETEEFYNDIKSGVFYLGDKKGVNVDYMSASLKYIKDENATGFICPYKENYSFVALLPYYDISIEDYVNNLTGEEFLNIINLDTKEECRAIMPKFKYEYDIDLKDVISNMGIKNACDETADFSKTGKFNTIGNTFIKHVIHKTNIEVSEEGTIAGAATVVRRAERSGTSNYNSVNLNRAFVYAIIDNNTKIPLLLGTVNNFQGAIFEIEGETPRGDYKVGTEDYIYLLSDVSDWGRIDKYIGKEKDVILPEMYDYDGRHYFRNIGSGAFEGNESVESITINQELDSISDRAFADCPNLKEVYVYNYFWFIGYIGEDIFEGSDNAVLYCYEGSMIHQYAVEKGVKFELIEPVKQE